MDKKQEKIVNIVESFKKEILEAERFLWAHPQTGYTEWEANEYLINRFEELGYKLIRADKDPKYGKIPGFYTDIDTGRPGPTLAIIGELDALDISTHPESVNGMTHCCGHHAQGAALYGLALAFKEKCALEGLSGKIRLMMVPAEEMIQLSFREQLRKQGIISYVGGKIEFLHRGYLDGVDLAMLVHGATDRDDIDYEFFGGHIGCIAKTITYEGKSAHAGAEPYKGINAQYASTLGLQAVNDLRETFKDEDSIRFHPILKGVNCAVNIIPDEMVIESYVRGNTIEAIKRENIKINRALTGAALAMGAKVHLEDRPGYLPEIQDINFLKLANKCADDLVGSNRVLSNYNRISKGSSDFGDITAIMPGIQFFSYGASGVEHGINYYVTDPYRLCVNSAKIQIIVAYELLKDDAINAKKIIEEYKPRFSSIKEYFASVNELFLDKDAIKYDESGNVTIDYK